MFVEIEVESLYPQSPNLWSGCKIYKHNYLHTILFNFENKRISALSVKDSLIMNEKKSTGSVMS